MTLFVFHSDEKSYQYLENRGLNKQSLRFLPVLKCHYFIMKMIIPSQLIWTSDPYILEHEHLDLFCSTCHKSLERLGDVGN